MQLTKSLVLAATMLSFTSAIAFADPVADAIADNDSTSFNPNYVDTGLEKRACDYNGCKCKKNKAGKWCGSWTDVVLKKGKGGKIEDIYQCAKNGDCCNYGHRKSCEL